MERKTTQVKVIGYHQGLGVTISGLVTDYKNPQPVLKAVKVEKIRRTTK